MHPFLVGLIHGRKDAQPLTSARLGGEEQGGRVDEVLLHERHESEQVLRERVRAADLVERAEQLRVDLGQQLAHHDPLLESIRQQALAVGRVITEEAGAEAVKGRDPRFAVVILQLLVDPARDLAGRACREREHEDLGTAGGPLAHRLRVEVDQRMRLPRARPGQHTEWSVYLI